MAICVFKPRANYRKSGGGSSSRGLGSRASRRRGRGRRMQTALDCTPAGLHHAQENSQALPVQNPETVADNNENSIAQEERNQ